MAKLKRSIAPLRGKENIMKKTTKNISQRGKENTKKRPLLINLTKNGHFKNYFKTCKPALKSLLKAFLPLPDKSSIQEVTLLDSLLPNLTTEEKDSIMDLRLQLNTGELVNVEMQAFPHKGFSERILFYWAKNYISQLNKGEQYKKLCPSYSLIFSKFDLFPRYRSDDLSKQPISGSANRFSGVRSERACNSFSIRSDKAPHFCFNKDLRFVIVELSKFQAEENVRSLVDFQDIWCYILKESRKMGQQEFKELSGRGPEMEEAMTYLRKFSEEEQRQILREAREKNLRDQVAREDYVFDQGKEEGREEGRLQGKEEGREEGRLQGKEEGRLQGKEEGRKEIALNMIQNKMETSVISKITGLSEKEIKSLK